MVFYKGALHYNDLRWMPIPRLLQLNSFAGRILDSQTKAIEEKKRG